MIALLLAAALTGSPSESAALAETSIDLANAWKIDDAERTALRAYETAIVCDDRVGLARALEAWSIAARLRGRAEEAMALAQESLAVAETNGDSDGRARANNAIGRVHADLLENREAARAAFESVLDISVSDRRVFIRAWLNLGNLSLGERDLRAARKAFLQASEIADAVDDPEGRIAAAHNIALTYSFQNDPNGALPWLTRAAGLDQRMGGAQQARIQLSISEARRALGDLNAAREALSRARRAAEKSGDSAALSTILLRQGELHVSSGELAAAERAFQQSASIARALSDAPALALIDAYRAKMMLAGQRWREAADLAAKAAATADALEQPDTVALAASTAGTAYRKLGDVRRARRSFEQAIRAVEQQRRSVAGGSDARLRFFERELSPYTALVDLLVANGNAVDALSYARRAKARVIGDARRNDVRTRRPRAGEAFIEYSISGETVYAFITTTEGTRVVTLPQNRMRIAELAVQFARELALRNLGFRPTARLLFDALIAPLNVSAKRWVIVPDLDLWLVPFHALIGADDRFLIESTTISYAPSGALITDSAPRANPRVLLAANLPDGSSELDAIRNVWPKPVVMNDATKAAFQQQASRFDLLHIAAHGVYDDADPLQSYLAFRDDHLTAREVLRMNLRASTVILSACDMAVGRPAAGEGLVGMTWALMIAGAETVIAAKWEVDSDTTARLMLELHRALASGARPAEALRIAQQSLLRSARWVHPFYWAGFVDLGNGE